MGKDVGNDDSQDYPDDAANEAEGDRLYDELGLYIGSLSAESPSYAYLLAPLRHGNEHDVHDADTPDYESDAPYCAKQQGK